MVTSLVIYISNLKAFTFVTHFGGALRQVFSWALSEFRFSSVLWVISGGEKDKSYVIN